MKVGDEVKIKMSPQLKRIGKSTLAKRRGKVAKLVYSCGQVIGVYVDIIKTNCSWRCFVPIQSVEGPEEVDKKRNESLLRTVVL